MDLEKCKPCKYLTLFIMEPRKLKILRIMKPTKLNIFKLKPSVLWNLEN